MDDDARMAERRACDARDNKLVIEAAITVAWWQLAHETHETLYLSMIEDRVLMLLPWMPADTIAQYRYMMAP
jgi:hypothetical protein